MDKNEIISLWKNMGWYTLKDYHDYLLSNDNRISLCELDPDYINPKEFWKAADEHFFTDPVCNHNNILGNQKLSIREANKLNYNIPLFMGMIGQVQGLASILKAGMGYVHLAEIGCGYGSFYENFIQNSNLYYVDYRGFDIIPRTTYALEIEGDDGCFSDNQLENYKDKFNLFFSSNTFQHLSKKQVEKYLNQVYDLIQDGGYFNVMYADANVSYHYGQKIELFNIQEFELLAKRIGFTIYGCSSMQIPNSLTPYSLVLKK